MCYWVECVGAVPPEHDSNRCGMNCLNEANAATLKILVPSSPALSRSPAVLSWLLLLDAVSSCALPREAALRAV